jgi:hypothetical protein
VDAVLNEESSCLAERVSDFDSVFYDDPVIREVYREQESKK